MKILHTLSALAIFTLIAVVIIVNFSLDPNISTVSTPTPKVVTRQIIKKVLVTPGSQTGVTTVNKNTAATSNPQLTNRCIITLDGASYDVTDFRNLHSGGDIFTCGTDMSALFWSRHGRSMFNRMQQYRL